MKNLTVKAPAKINLYLDVFAKRNDGYHDIESVMQTVSLYDEIEVCLTDKTGITLTSNNKRLPLDARNIAYKAAALFFSTTKINSGAKIHIEKKIPVASGLAGGSTDAGAALLALNELYDKPLSMEELLSLGETLGADVPFCMQGGCALCRGKGEALAPLPKMTPYTVVIARGGRGISTPKAYSLLDEKFACALERPFSSLDNVISAVKRDSLSELSDSLYNVFEEVILPIHSEAAKYREMLLHNGAIAAMMSGSGPAVFGIFDDTEKADYAHHYLYDAGARSFVCTAK